MRRPRVLVFSLGVNVETPRGFTIATRNCIANLARIPDMEFVVVSAGEIDARAASDAYIGDFGLEHLFVPFLPTSAKTDDRLTTRIAQIARRVLNFLTEKYYFIGERRFKKQRHVDSAVREIVLEKKPDLVVIYNTLSALLIPSIIASHIPCCLITIVNDVAAHQSLKSQRDTEDEGAVRGFAWRINGCANWISNARFRRRFNWIVAHCAGVVALTQSDLPTKVSPHTVLAVIPPVLERSTVQWSYTATRSVFFVGNVEHAPNRQAMEWICRRLAPELSRVDNTVRINIVGAGPEAPSQWRRSNVSLMGRADKNIVLRHLTNDDIFIAPIENGFGAKMKLAECVSHGTPFAATCGAMSGLPFLTAPKIDLDNPAKAAELLVDYMNKPEELTKLSQLIGAQADRARAEQTRSWAGFLMSSIRAGISR